MSTDLELPPLEQAEPVAPPPLNTEELEHVAVPTATSGSKVPFFSTMLGKLLLLTSLVTPTLGGVAYYLAAQQQHTPRERFLQARDEIKKGPATGDITLARQLAKELESTDYRDPDFPGGVEFILGMSAFYEAENPDTNEFFREQLYLLASTYLKTAEERSVPPAFQWTWAFALGVSLYKIGSYSEALPLLETDVLQFTLPKPEDMDGKRADELDEQLKRPEGVKAGMLVADLHLHEKEHQGLQKAKYINDKILQLPFLAEKDRDRVWLQRAQILLGLKNQNEARTCLSRVSSRSTNDRSTQILYAQTLMADGTEQSWKEAIAKLEPVAKSPGVDDTYPRQARYMLGLCYLSLGKTEEAIKEFRNSKSSEWTQEAVASSVKLGDIFRLRDGYDGDSLAEYGDALRSVKSPTTYRNRWLDLDRFRQSIRDAWEYWTSQKKFDRAIQLSEMMSPLFPQEEMYDFLARATMRWAESRQREYDQAGYSQKASMWEDVKRRWNRSGQAYHRLADTLRASKSYPDAIWISAEHFILGQDHLGALEALDQFIATRHPKLLPRAMVLRSKTLMNLERYDAAEASLRTVIANYPVDVISIEARYLIGECLHKAGKTQEAEKTWRDLINSPNLNPKALEWQKSLLGLTRLKFRAAEKLYREALAARREQQDKLEEDRLREAFPLWKDATDGLVQYIDRYADVPATGREGEIPDVNYVRYELAYSLSAGSEMYDWEFRHATNENSRKEARAKREERLDQALTQYRVVQSALQKLRDRDALDEAGNSLLRNCYFETAGVLMGLARYQESIDAYTTAANRYPQQSDTLSAYLQIALCYESLKKPAEARSMLEQAKVILREIPDKAFEGDAHHMRKTDWARWLERATTLNPDGTL